MSRWKGRRRWRTPRWFVSSTRKERRTPLTLLHTSVGSHDRGQSPRPRVTVAPRRRDVYASPCRPSTHAPPPLPYARTGDREPVRRPLRPACCSRGTVSGTRRRVPIRTLPALQRQPHQSTSCLHCSGDGGSCDCQTVSPAWVTPPPPHDDVSCARALCARTHARASDLLPCRTFKKERMH